MWKGVGYVFVISSTCSFVTNGIFFIRKTSFLIDIVFSSEKFELLIFDRIPKTKDSFKGGYLHFFIIYGMVDDEYMFVRKQKGRAV